MDSDSAESRWDAYERSKRYGYPGLRDPTLLPPSCPVVRVRREYNARDAINSRAWDFFQVSASTPADSARGPHGCSIQPAGCATQFARDV